MQCKTVQQHDITKLYCLIESKGVARRERGTCVLEQDTYQNASNLE